MFQLPSNNPQDPANLARIAVAQRDLGADRLAAYRAKVVAAAPPFTPEQRDRIASLLRPTGGAA